MSREIDVLLSRVEDPSLRADLRTQFDRAGSKRRFGLVFEDHLPERVRLPGHPVRSGVNVVLRADPDDNDIRHVTRVRNSKATLLVDDGTTEQVAVEELVVVADFGQPIHPGLRHLGSVHRGGDKPAHVVIKGENHHALELLQFTHAGKVDCIYIDPPYNTGARDWKYGNDYVDENDAYRHSKWLAFMNRRLRLAKQLLNPENSVLIVTIDEREYLRLGMLLEQVFSGARIQMVSSVIKAGGVSRAGAFGRSDEYLYFVQLGESRALSVALSEEWNPVRTKNKYSLRWKNGMRSGSGARRIDSPNLFFPVFVRNTDDGPVFDSVGDALIEGDRNTITAPTGCEAVWPIRQNGSEGRWMFSAPTLRSLIAAGHARLGQWNKDKTTVYYLARGEREKIENKVFTVTGHNADGSVIVDDESYTPEFLPTTQWNITSHDAGYGGARLLASVIPNRRFPFPKSLYAVEDALRFFVINKPDALVVDFFGGSGTTAHAVARLNRQDGGRRHSVVVTNNEVSDGEAKVLRAAGYQPGDPEWEALGIFEHVTRPRIEAAVTGVTPDGEPVKGGYKFTDEFPMAEGFEENVEFFELTYLDPEDVELDLAFEGIAPLLWMRAGCAGPILTSRTNSKGRPVPYLVDDRYGVLFDTDRWRRFVDALPDSAAAGFVVTDSASVFAGVAAELPGSLDLVRLYENYLSTFAINQGR